MAYGKLAPNMQELSEEEILKMLDSLAEEEEGQEKKDTPENNVDKIKKL